MARSRTSARCRQSRRPDLTAIVDPGMPKWLHEEMSALLPRVLGYYAEKMGAHLPTRPFIVMSYGDAANPDAFEWAGSTLAGMIEFDGHLGVHYRAADNADVTSFVPRMVAHEAAHLWNSGVYLNGADERGGTWLHAGGADAFAYRALRDLGVETRAAYLNRLSGALSSCVFGLSDLGEPLTKSSTPSAFMNYYHCGSTLELWSEALMANAHAGGDLFALWRGVFRSSHHGQYDDALYFDRLAHLGADAAALRTFVETRIDDPDAWLVDSLTKAGIAIREDDAAAAKSTDYAHMARGFAARIVLASDGCVGASSRSTGDAPCRTLPKNATLESMADTTLLTMAYAPTTRWPRPAPRRAGASRSRSPPIRGLSRIRCERAVPPRPRYLRVLRAP